VQVTFSILRASGTLPGQAAIDQANQNATVLIPAHNNPFGVFSLSDAMLIVTKPTTGLIATVSVDVVRSWAALATAILQWSAVGDATSLVFPNGTIVLAPDQWNAAFDVEVQFQPTPELTRMCIISIQPINGGVANVASARTQLVIEQHAFPYGNVSFIAASCAVSEPATGLVEECRFTLVRSAAIVLSNHITAKIQFVTIVDPITAASAQLGSDYFAVTQVVDFPPNTTTATFSVYVVNDNIPEFDEPFGVEVNELCVDDALNPGIRIGNIPRITVTILANNVPGGFVAFANNSTDPVANVFSEHVGANGIALMLNRTGGLFGSDV